jgi:hypothetical protein
MGKEEDFERLWESSNYIKRQQYRQKLMQWVMQLKLEPTKENCKSYWMGELKGR